MLSLCPEIISGKARRQRWRLPLQTLRSIEAGAHCSSSQSKFFQSFQESLIISLHFSIMDLQPLISWEKAIGTAS